MLTEIKACYSPHDLIFITSLFILVAMAIGAFSILMIHTIKGALEEVKHFKNRDKNT
jgi:hypothetical protein